MPKRPVHLMGSPMWGAEACLAPRLVVKTMVGHAVWSSHLTACLYQCCSGTHLPQQLSCPGTLRTHSCALPQAHTPIQRNSQHFVDTG